MMELPLVNDAPSPLSLDQPDSIKLFVGQVPRTYDERDLRPIFEPFGEISELVILRDRQTGASKGAHESSFMLTINRMCIFDVHEPYCGRQLHP